MGYSFIELTESNTTSNQKLQDMTKMCARGYKVLSKVIIYLDSKKLAIIREKLMSWTYDSWENLSLP